MDTLWGGSNMELTMQNTMARRPGFPTYDTVPLPAGDIADQFFSYQNLSGSITTLVDTQTAVYIFTPSSLSSILFKSAGAGETSFLRVGNILYMADGVDFVATAYNGTVNVATPVGLAVPVTAPSILQGVPGAGGGMAPPTSGISYGYSFENSSTGQVSTMSPATATTGDLDVSTITESSIVVTVTSAIATGSPTDQIAFGCVNNFTVGDSVTISGFTSGGDTYVNQTYTVLIATGSQFTASTSGWGASRAGNLVSASGLIGCVGRQSPITVPGSSASPAYTYFVTDSAPQPNNPNNPTGVYLAASIGTASTALVKIGGVLGTAVANTGDVNGTGKFYDYGTGEFLFYSGDANKSLSLTYNITPTGIGNPVVFKVGGISAQQAIVILSQPDTTGYVNVDSIVIYRTLDGDAVAGPWYYLATIPDDNALVSAVVSGSTTTYTFAVPVPAGANNGFAGATGTGGATIAGFSNAGNNGRFDITASTTTTITVTNSSGVNETHAGTVNATSWFYTDTGSVYGYSYNGTVPDGELDTLIEAPIDDENNPPPSLTNPLTTSVTGTFSLITYYAGRLWGAVDNFVYFAGGPDVTFGSPTESFPPANVFTFPGKVTALAPTPAGLIVFTSDTMFIIYGTSLATFYSQVYLRNRGVLSQNCVVMDEQTLYIYTTQRQCFSYSNQEAEIGYNVSPLFTLYFPPTAVYLTYHRMGEDVGLFISDGSVNYMKYRTDTSAWSPMCQIVGGADAFQSIETSNGVYTLMVGSATGGGFISGRSTTSWTDTNGTYPCSVIVGSFITAPPGAISKIDYLTGQWMPTGTIPTFSILADEIATLAGVGPWVSLQGTNDPPKLVPSQSITQQRFYLKSANQPVPQELCHLMVQVSYGAANTNDQLLTLGIT
jgi:hypothetical protein